MTLIGAVLLLHTLSAPPTDTLRIARSAAAVPLAVAHLSAAIAERELTLFGTIDHAANAANVGESLRPTVVLVFGNPRAGTLLMRCGQEVGIDLPLRILVWEDATGAVFAGYEDPVDLAARHRLIGCDSVVSRMRGLLAGLIQTVATP